ncbi:polyprenyl synthetase family protein [Streptomyces sp. S3(2020)]|uniref:polyprenyl synthetase family protein n=1 Tax=Streptomyces sp. S3(2020) TaxID=2732044 RepID=UPI0014878C82|nr:polyprenyl synthetase family protein [Streptomyces sp. S3(2020)]NNN31384.1 polyprenyl synthetase family protein [Streptomyces sp. S3(2020)]
MTVEITADVHERLTDYRDRFEALFVRYFDELAQQGLPRSSFVPEALELVRDMSLRGGKRLRVALLHESARLVTDDQVAGLEEAALSIELLQTHGLIHDDIVDDSPVRRGAPSVYYAYRERFPDHPHTALGLAVLAGDLAAFLSVQVLLRAPVPRELRQAMAAVQATAGADTVIGQVLDLERDFGPVPDRSVLDAVSDYKSARYSVLAPLRLGLLAAGQDPADHEGELARYATLVGVSGQLCDDYLDLFGDEETVGKPAGSDLRAGRRSYAVCAVLAATAGRERNVVESALAEVGCAPQTVAQVRDIARRHGVDEQLRAEIRRIAGEASAVAAGWRGHWRAEAVDFFEGLPRWGAQRAL